MTPRNRIAAIIATILFFVLVGTTTATALWSTTATVGASVKVANLAAACGTTAMVNASFEDPALATNLGYANDGDMPGWRAKDAAGNPVRIEIWRGYDNVAAGTGAQHVELNADVPGTLFQTLDTVPGQTLQWSLMHRGRSGTDVMQLLIGAENATGVSQGNFSDDNTAWKRYSGAYVVPAGQTRTTLAFQAVSAAGGPSIGNFLDDVSFGSGPCLANTTTVSNITNPGGTFRPNDVIEYTSVVTNSGSSLSQGTVYEAVVPTGLTYNTGSITIDGAPRTDALAGDEANYVTADRKVVARLGTGASGTAGGTIAQNTQTVTVKFRATIPAASAGTTISLTPSVTYFNGLATGWALTATSNTATFSVANGADLAVTAVAPNVQKATTNTDVVWTVTVTNNGPLASGTNSTVTITLPTGVTGNTLPISTTAPTNGATCAAISGGQSVCTIAGGLAVGASRSFTVTRTVAAAAAVGSTFSLSATAATTVGDPIPANNSATSTVTVIDTIAPTVPGKPAATASTATTIALTWAVSTDAGGVAYDIYRDGVLVGTSATNSYTSSGLTAWNAYSFTVVARDPAGNLSAASPAGVIVAAPNSVFRISRDPVGGDGLYCVAAGNTNNGSVLRMGTACGSTDIRNFEFLADVDGYVKIRMDNRTVYWTVPTNAASGSSITSSNSVAGNNQKWVVIPRGGTMYSFQSASHPTLCIERISNTELELRTCNASVSPQQFDLTAR